MNTAFLFNGFYFLSLHFCLTRFESPLAKKANSVLLVEIFSSTPSFQKLHFNSFQVVTLPITKITGALLLLLNHQLELHELFRFYWAQQRQDLVFMQTEQQERHPERNANPTFRMEPSFFIHYVLHAKVPSGCHYESLVFAHNYEMHTLKHQAEGFHQFEMWHHIYTPNLPPLLLPPCCEWGPTHGAASQGPHSPPSSSVTLPNISTPRKKEARGSTEAPSSLLTARAPISTPQHIPLDARQQLGGFAVITPQGTTSQSDTKTGEGVRQAFHPYFFLQCQEKPDHHQPDKLPQKT